MFKELPRKVRADLKQKNIPICKASIGEISKKDIIEFLSIQPEKINVIPLGVDKEFKPVTANKIKSIKNKYFLPERYLLYVGDVNPNKNLPVLLRVVAKLKINLVIGSILVKKKH